LAQRRSFALALVFIAGCKPDARCDGQCALSMFLELEQTFRPSNHEDAAQKWVQQKLAEAIANEVWTADEAPSATDAAGNLLIRLPATAPGEQDRKPVVLQAHLDMVLAVDGAAPGEPLEPYFTSGVDVVQEDGIMHSRNYKTTLGADNGVGVAQLVRYIVDRSIPHPPLELVFTTAEELGLFGAQRYDAAALPLHGTVIINLDGMSVADWEHPDLHQPLAITYGANGAMLTNLDGKLRTAPLAASAQLLDLSLHGLLGGHSGIYINLKRMNSIRAAAALLQQLVTLGQSPQLVSLAVGQVQARSGHNKIPDSFAMTVALPATADLAAVSQSLKTFFAGFAADYTDEDQSKIQLQLGPSTMPASVALPKDVTAALASVLSTTPNGVIKANPDYPEGVEISSNLGVLGISGAASEQSFYLGYLPRAYDLQTAGSVAEQIHTQVSAVLTGDGAESGLGKTPVPPWLVPQDAGPIQIAHRVAGDLLKQYIRMPSSTEVGVFMTLFPALQNRGFGLGPVITDAHTPRESMNVSTFLDATQALDTILTGFGEDPTLLK
jgi:dipeptidase D